MDNSLPISTLKSERRSKSKSMQTTSTPSLVMALLSCLAWLYIAGRPNAVTVEDKLATLGCKDLERRIVETEMELTMAKSQGYLKNQVTQSGSSSGKKLLAVIGVYTGFGSQSSRNMFRASWMPKGDGLTKLEERGVIIRFVVGRSPNRGDTLDRTIDAENRSTKDFLILDDHEEAEEELPKKTKLFFASAIQIWDADFYVKCLLKSGDVVADEGKQWYEPAWWKFGDAKSYMRHAAGPLFILSKDLAQYIHINRLQLLQIIKVLVKQEDESLYSRTKGDLSLHHPGRGVA
ncbi:hypothetical protein Leryth_012089 [Lithospermum erythrorhizon]|nr:hypothetical protein Leryth_012089 [Lithospermum erythrorhizon]